MSPLLGGIRLLLKGYPTVQNTGSTARDHLANERTFLAWTRSSLALIALGIGLERFESLRQDLVRGIPTLAASGSSAPSPSAPSGEANTRKTIHTEHPKSSINNNRVISLVLTTTGAVTSLQSTWRYYSVMHQLQAGVFKPSVRGVFVIGVSSIAIVSAVLRSEVDQYRLMESGENR